MKLDKSYRDTWITRSIKLDGQPYPDYLKSDEWQTIKRKAYTRSRYRSCYVCGISEHLELHHRSYNTLGSTDLRNVLALCRKHHQGVHDYARSQDISVRLATKKYRRLVIRNNLYPRE